MSSKLLILSCVRGFSFSSLILLERELGSYRLIKGASDRYEERFGKTEGYASDVSIRFSRGTHNFTPVKY
jgi:hypothetical protein